MATRSPAHVLEHILPRDVISVIHSFVPTYPKKKKFTVSPSAQNELKKLQYMALKGKSGMYMRDLEDFCLD